MIPLVLVFAGIPAITLFVSKLMHKELSGKAGLICASIGIAGLLIAPAVWSFTPLMLGVNTSSPGRRPDKYFLWQSKRAERHVGSKQRTN